MSSPSNTAADAALLAVARQARELAWAPYSRFKVGAAVRTDDGRIFAGCNVENAAYGLCNCAERTALFSAIAAGARPGQISALAVIGDTAGPISPCGACRQVMIELGGPALRVLLANLGGAQRLTTAAGLLPDGFAFDPPPGRAAGRSPAAGGSPPMVADTGRHRGHEDTDGPGGTDSDGAGGGADGGGGGGSD